MAMVKLMLISCSNVIRIHTASYGRTDKTTCSAGRPANQLSRTDCSASTTLPITSGSKTSLLSIHQLQSFTCLSKYNICPSNPGSNVIHIHKANYGRTDKTTCSSGRPANQLSNTNCYAPTTLPIIRDRLFDDTREIPPSYFGPKLEDIFTVDKSSNVIHIHKANYGRTDKTTCSSGRPANQLSNTNCYAPTTLPIIRDRCEGKTTCAVQASHLIFSDPCGGIYKYLDISYSCVPPISHTSASKTSLLSIHQLQSFAYLSKYNVCPSNPGSNVIHIHKANYGRTDKTTCSSGRPANQLSNTNCYAPTTLPIIRNRSVHDLKKTQVLLCKGVSVYKSSYSRHMYCYLFLLLQIMMSSSSGSNVIRIHTASYGRTDKTTCSSGRPANQLSRTDCSASTTLPI
ncbi:rhamnose-binding lectin-like, partial [Clupea harengus]|uniref:Rhamnose-binding lectin-like n=1 Tax=Clupea harengus TaxID=7950 RepID=A0A8M1KKK2_CLUHA